jgi:hypothetical protein
VKNHDKNGLVLLHPRSGRAHITSAGMAERRLLTPA